MSSSILGASPSQGPRPEGAAAESAAVVGERLVDRFDTKRFPVADTEGSDFDLAEFVKTASASGADDSSLTLLDQPQVRALLRAIVQGSPYLSGLVRRDPQRLLDILSSNPSRRLRDQLARVDDLSRVVSPDQAGLNELAKAAREVKSDLALLIALADLGGVWSLDQVTEALTSLADVTVASGVRQLLRVAAARGKLRPEVETDPDRGCGYFILAMGKHGARELNYSSDIDLIVFYERDQTSLVDPAEVQAFFVRLTQQLVKFMSERTPAGYVFRTDLRLRPDPGATQVAMSTDAAFSYYVNFGQNWERAALIKARPIAGDLAQGQAFLDSLAPFIWRKYLDFAAIADIHAMKRQINAHKGFASVAIGGHDIKVGRGGIREIEVFAQTQQLIAGGRQRDLRVPRTLDALDQLARRSWIDPAAKAELAESYVVLRTIEHRLQMVADEQTQRLPVDAAALQCFARFCGYPTTKAFADMLRGHLERVERRYAALFEKEPTTESSEQVPLLVSGADPDEALDEATANALASRGFKDPKRVAAIVRGWRAGRHKALATDRARALLDTLQPALLAAVAETVEPEQALIGFDRLLSGMSSGVQFLSLLRAKPEILRLIADITGSAPRLAQTLARRRRVLDAVLDTRELDESLPSLEAYRAAARAALEGAESFEDVLDRVRVFGSEQLFLIGIRVLAGRIGAEQAGHAYATLAEVLISELHDEVTKDFISRHGEVPGAASCVLAMGKLGGREMTAASDLDLILVYDAPDDQQQSNGARPLAVSQYYARLTQRLIAALAAPTAQGALYDVDLRLRPSGQKGPVATRFESFASYQRNDAWTWEHMALTRARVVSGPEHLRRKIEEIVQETLVRPRDPAHLAGDVRDMRERIAGEKGSDELWELKHVRGGLVDLEFIAQFGQLRHASEDPAILSQTTSDALSALDRIGALGTQSAVLMEAAKLYHELTQVLRLCFDGRFRADLAPNGLKAFLAHVAKSPDFATLEAHLADVQRAVARAFDEIVQPE